MKVIIAGSRTITSYKTVADAVELFRDTYGADSITEVVCGTARGVARLGYLWAQRNGLPNPKCFPPKWTLHGRKKAGYICNVEMAAHADGDGQMEGGLIAVHDGSSPGTAHMVKIAENRGMRVVKVVVRRRVMDGKMGWVPVAVS